MFVTRKALVDYSTTNGIRGLRLALKLPYPAKCTARYGLIADHYHRLKDRSTVLATDQGEADYFFHITPLTDLGLFGHITISLIRGVQILVAFGFDRTFRAICVVLPLCTKMYKQGLTAHSLSLGYDELCGEPEGSREFSDQTCDFFALSCAGRFLESFGELDRTGIHLSMNLDFSVSDQFQITLSLDADRFMQHYFPEQEFSDKTTQEASAALQDKLEAPRKKLLGWT